jgi:biopolymer transport protein ExbD
MGFGIQLPLQYVIPMNMQQVTGFSLLLFLAARPTGARAMEDVPHSDVLASAKYQRADANFYGKGDVARAHPTAVIIPQGAYTQAGDSYLFTPKGKAPKSLFAETTSDWIEPITPPDRPASLGVAPDAMQIREPQGDVEVALPSAPANFSPVTSGMTLPNGAVLKTGADGTAAVLFGGVDSARLMPNSEAAVQQTVTAQTRSAEVDLTAGGVFSKVGTQVGVKGEYEVHTPFGNAVAPGGDFVTIIANARTDVWVAQGTVQFNRTDGKTGPAATSDGTGPLKIMRLPAISDPHLSFLADTETLTAVLNFIPLADQKIMALRDKQAAGVTLTANEQAYLTRIKKVPCVIKLALVEPPAPKPVVAPLVTAPAVESAPAPSVAATLPAKLKPLPIDLRADGQVDFNNETITLDDLKAQLAAIAESTPTQSLSIRGKDTVSHEQLEKVIALCKAAKLKVHVSSAHTHPQPILSTSATPVLAPLPMVSTPALAPLPPPAPTPSPADASAQAAAPADTTTPTTTVPAPAKPLRAVVRVDGKINFQKVTLTPDEFKSRINALVQATPDQAIVIKAGKTVPYDKFETVMNICRAAQVKNLSVAGTPPTPAESAADNLPAPGLLMHPSMPPSAGSPDSSASPTSTTPTNPSPAPASP